jgi:membrane-associated phospholipid phosphatase
MKTVGIGAVGAAVSHQWDAAGIESSQRYFHPGLFEAGNIGGTFLVQAGASFGLYSVARLTGSRSLAAAGADLVRAQVLSQGIVQAGKFATHRQRPDGSNDHSLPSGHTASAFATATVLQRHFGWRVGAPAYAFGAYVAASRMSANKHHLSDVLLGASIGIASARTVTVGLGRAQFGLGVTPTDGGAAIMFTKR